MGLADTDRSVSTFQDNQDTGTWPPRGPSLRGHTSLCRINHVCSAGRTVTELDSSRGIALRFLSRYIGGFMPPSPNAWISKTPTTHGGKSE